MAETFKNILYSFLIFTASVVVVALAGAFVLHLSPKIVLSGSMEPEIKTGSMVFIKTSIPPEKITERDIIAYEINKEFQVLHRVVAIDREKKQFHTKGDANKSVDAGEIDFTQYLGKAVFSIPFLGYLVSMFQNKIFIFAMIVLWGGFMFRERRLQSS